MLCGVLGREDSDGEEGLENRSFEGASREEEDAESDSEVVSSSLSVVIAIGIRFRSLRVDGNADSQILKFFNRRLWKIK